MASFKKVRRCTNKWHQAMGDKETWFEVVNLENIAYVVPGIGPSAGSYTIHFVGGPAALICVGHIDEFLEVSNARTARS